MQGMPGTISVCHSGKMSVVMARFMSRKYSGLISLLNFLMSLTEITELREEFSRVGKH